MVKYVAIGCMSGTSLDGLDIALCEFNRIENNWLYQITEAITIYYDDELKSRLSKAHTCNSLELSVLHKEFGNFIGEQVKLFLAGKDKKIDLIASHGHTVFHEPARKVNLQIGDGAVINAITNTTVVSDFRSSDIALGGQGAPLVPFGDRYLFSEYDFCLNLGGFANISYTVEEKTIAYDICPVNIILNQLSQQYYKKEYDANGEIGKSGKVNYILLENLNNLPYYSKFPPKSLGREWVEENILPLLEEINDNPSDVIRTLYEHISIQLSKNIENEKDTKVLLSGGGARNTFLIELLRRNSTIQWVIPDDDLIDYKEALIFAFLGVMRIRGEINCLSSVTGAEKDHSAGCVYQLNSI